MRSRSCRQYRADLSELADGRIEGARRLRLEAHLAACPACRALVAAHRRVTQLVRGVERPLLRGSIVGDVLQRIGEQAPEHRLAPWLYWSGAGAAIATVVLAIGLLMRPTPTPLVRHSPLPPTIAVRETMSALSDKTDGDLCAREHARVSASYARAERAAWSVTLAEGNREVVRQ